MSWLHLSVALLVFSFGTTVYGDDDPPTPKPIEPTTPKEATPTPAPSSSDQSSTTPSTPAPVKPKPKAIIGSLVGTIVKIDKDKNKITIKVNDDKVTPGAIHGSGLKAHQDAPKVKKATKEETFDMTDDVRVKLIRSSGSSTYGSMADVSTGQTVQLDFSNIKTKDGDGKTEHHNAVTKIELATDEKKK